MKSRGRPKTTGPGVQIGMRWQPPELEAIDDWRRKQTDLPSRTEAIRRLVELGLKAKQRNPKAAAKALDLAGQQIDKLADPSATAEERHQRKRRLLKGPGEFRELRADLPKRKT
jgi:hypothetical protein